MDLPKIELEDDGLIDEDSLLTKEDRKRPDLRKESWFTNYFSFLFFFCEFFPEFVKKWSQVRFSICTK